MYNILKYFLCFYRLLISMVFSRRLLGFFSEHTWPVVVTNTLCWADSPCGLTRSFSARFKAAARSLIEAMFPTVVKRQRKATSLKITWKPRREREQDPMWRLYSAVQLSLRPLDGSNHPITLEHLMISYVVKRVHFPVM